LRFDDADMLGDEVEDAQAKCFKGASNAIEGAIAKLSAKSPWEKFLAWIDSLAPLRLPNDPRTAS
jgi:hypothetical protein